MALLFLDSFDHYATADMASKWTQYVNTNVSATCKTSIAVVGARATSGLKLETATTTTASTGSLNAVPVMPLPSGATHIVGFRFRSVTPFATLGNDTINSESYGSNGVNNACLYAIRYLGTTQVWLRLETNGKLAVYRGSTLLGTTSAALVQNVWQYIELKVLIHVSAGTVGIHIDGVSQLSLTSQNTRNHASVALWDEFRVGPIATSTSPAATNEWNIDDFYVADATGSDWNDFKGDIRVDAVFPTAEGNTSGYTCSTGSTHYTLVDEASANGDTDYNSAATVALKDTLNFPNVPVAGATIYGLQICTQARKTDAGSAGSKSVTRIASTDYEGAEYAVSSGYSILREPQAVKPSDSTAWTDTAFNAAEFGYEKSS